MSTVSGALYSLCRRSAGKVVAVVARLKSPPGIKSIVRGVDLVVVAVRLVWSRRGTIWTGMFALRVKATMAFPTSQMKRLAVCGRRDRNRGAIDIRQHRVDSRGLAVAGDEDGMFSKRDRDDGPRRRPRARLAGKFGARSLTLLACLAVLADGLPAVTAARPQAI